MINTTNNIMTIENTDIEIRAFKNGLELTPNELANPKVKPTYFKIGLLELGHKEFKTLPEIKRGLRSEIGVIEMLNNINDTSTDKLALLRTLKKQKQELERLTRYKEISLSMDLISTRKQNKINKGIKEATNE